MLFYQIFEEVAKCLWSEINNWGKFKLKEHRVGKAHRCGKEIYTN